MDDDLVCNFKKCRKRITNVAWVTSCSHIFCEDDGSREFAKQQACPACDTVLSGQLDFIQVDIHPSEQYKSMVLAGQRPEVIMEICSRAMSFWTYQAHQERAYQEYLATKAIEKSQNQEGYYQNALAVNQSELTHLKAQVSSLKKDLEAIKSKYNETSEKLMEKTRQYQKLQGMYESLRRRNINPSSLDGDTTKGSPRGHHPLKPHPFELPIGSISERTVHNLHKRQMASTDFFLPSGQVSVLPCSSESVHVFGGGISQTLTSAPATSVFQLDPPVPLASSVNTTTFHTQQGKSNEKFTIKMNKGSIQAHK